MTKWSIMGKKISQHEFDEIIKIIESFSKGASFQEIISVLKKPLQQRSLQRRLALLVKKGIIIAIGDSRARRYRVSSEKKKEISSLSSKTKKNDIIFLSLAAKEIQKKVTKPIQTRLYVNYNREFLDKYQPNNTFYLPTSVRQHFFEIGKTDGKRIAGTYARQIFNRLLIDLTWNSSRLEGNTYSILETERLLQLNEIVEGKKLEEAQMILNHKAAIEFLVESSSEIGINRYTILNLHALLSNNLLGNPDSCGCLRKISVGIAKTVYHPTAIPQLIEECFQQIIDKAYSIQDPFEQAFFLMIHLPYLQPFEDVNKRVSRLAANIPLILQNLCPLSFVDVPQELYINGLIGIYELNRIDLFLDVFIWAYERSCLLYSTVRKTLGEPDPFRMKYHKLIFEMVTNIVLGCFDKIKAIKMIREKANKTIPSQDRAKFIESVEIELRGLHEGNIARYRLRPSEYVAWRKIWR
jgi:hypothetical protein